MQACCGFPVAPCSVLSAPQVLIEASVAMATVWAKRWTGCETRMLLTNFIFKCFGNGLHYTVKSQWATVLVPNWHLKIFKEKRHTTDSSHNDLLNTSDHKQSHEKTKDEEECLHSEEGQTDVETAPGTQGRIPSKLGRGRGTMPWSP